MAAVWLVGRMVAGCLFVWSLEVALFYSTNGGFGEKFDWVYSSVEAGGYLIVTCGIFLYTKGQAEAFQSFL